jgi:hypothetical protein
MHQVLAGCAVNGQVSSVPSRCRKGTRSIRAARRLLSQRLHRQSVSELTSRAAFPRTASAFAIAWYRQPRVATRRILVAAGTVEKQ